MTHFSTLKRRLLNQLTSVRDLSYNKLTNDQYCYMRRMVMKINSKILSIPPYISTSWKNIASLHIETQQPMLILVVTLLSGVRIEVPDLESTMMEAIFAAHTRFLEQEEKVRPPKPLKASP